MTYLSILEKMKILFNTLLDFKMLLVFTGLLIILTILYLIKKLNGKRYTKCIILSIIISLLTSILDNQKALSNTFNDFTTLFFRNIYFPSIYVYISIIVILLISTIVTLLNKNTKKVYKVINSSTLILNSVLFILILNIIAKNKIDVFSINSLYTNTPLVVTLEISTGLFLLWVGLLIIAYTTNCIIDRMVNRKETLEEIALNVNNNIPQEANIISAIEPNINSVVIPNIEAPLTVEPSITPINYIHIPTTENIEVPKENNISFQDILERISTIEKIDGNIDDIDIFSDEQYNEIKVLS